LTLRRARQRLRLMWCCRLVAECGLVQGRRGICGSGPYGVAFGVAKICCGNAYHPVIAISVVPKLGTTQAVWMPGH